MWRGLCQLLGLQQLKLAQKAAVGGCSAAGSLENVVFAFCPLSSILSQTSSDEQ